MYCKRTVGSFELLNYLTLKLGNIVLGPRKTWIDWPKSPTHGVRSRIALVRERLPQQLEPSDLVDGDALNGLHRLARSWLRGHFPIADLAAE